MRTHFLVYPKLQLTHLAWILGAVSVSLVFGYVAFESVVATAFPPDLVPSESFLALRHQLRTGFAVLLVIILVAVGIETYFYFHRVVGPLAAIEKSLRRMRAGDYGYPLHLRESDQLHELATLFEETRAVIRSRMEEYDRDVASLAEELGRVASDGKPEAIAALREKLNRVRRQAETKAA